MLFGYGVAVHGLAVNWPRARVPAARRATLTWSTREGDLPTDPGVWTAESGDSFSIGWAGYADYRVTRDQDEGRVEVMLGGASPDEAALGFAFSVLPSALPLFELEPFHGAALGVSEAALLVLGRSTAGKSTTAHALTGLGCRFLADDACAIDDDGLLWPGPSLYAARSIGDDSPSSLQYDGKSVVTVAGHDGSPRDVGAAVVLEPRPGARLAVRQLRGSESLVALLGQVRAAWALQGLRGPRQLRIATRLAEGPVGVLAVRPGGAPAGRGRSDCPALGDALGCSLTREATPRILMKHVPPSSRTRNRRCPRPTARRFLTGGLAVPTDGNRVR